MFARLRHGFLLGALTCLLGIPSPALSASGGMTVDDILDLLKAGVGEKVIIRQTEATGTRLRLTVDALLQLKAAGASDRLLEALLTPPDAASDDPGSGAGVAAPTTRPAGPQAGGPSFRIYKERNEKGEEVLHITNLDASGRRIGGEVEDHVPPNLIHRPAQPSSDAVERYAEPEEDEGRQQAPVVVNIYPPDQGAAPPEEDPGYGGYRPTYPSGLYPGYPIGYAPAYHVHGPSCGHYGHHFLQRYYFSPPGSYSHFLRYHHDGATGGEVGLFSRPRAISTLPYAHGTAAWRNRARWRAN